MDSTQTDSLPVWQEGIGKIFQLSECRRRKKGVLAGMAMSILLLLYGSFLTYEILVWGGECTRRTTFDFEFFPHRNNILMTINCTHVQFGQ